MYIVLLDAGVLGLACCRPGTHSVDQCHAWLAALGDNDTFALIAAIVDYEVRRELIRLEAHAKLRNLDELREQLSYIDVSIPAWIRAAEFWAMVRNIGLPTADPQALD